MILAESFFGIGFSVHEKKGGLAERFRRSKDGVLLIPKPSDFITSVCEVISSVELYDTALRIAVERKITAYDALFVAASEKYNAPLATADRDLAKKISNVILVR